MLHYTAIIMGGTRGSNRSYIHLPTCGATFKIISTVEAWSEYVCHAIPNECLVVRFRSHRPAKLLRGCARVWVRETTRMYWNVLPSWPAFRASHELRIECSPQHTLPGQLYMLASLVAPSLCSFSASKRDTRFSVWCTQPSSHTRARILTHTYSRCIALP